MCVLSQLNVWICHRSNFIVVISQTAVFLAGHSGKLSHAVAVIGHAKVDYTYHSFWFDIFPGLQALETVLWIFRLKITRIKNGKLMQSSDLQNLKFIISRNNFWDLANLQAAGNTKTQNASNNCDSKFTLIQEYFGQNKSCSRSFQACWVQICLFILG